MKQYKDVIYTAVHSTIMVFILVIACFINNELIKGILLFLFSGALVGNTVYKLLTKRKDKLRSKVFYSVILFFNSLLVIGAISVMVMAIV